MDEELYKKVKVFLPYEVVTNGVTADGMDWLYETLGDPLFGSFGRLLNSKSLWASYYNVFYFKNKEDAVQFKLTWG